MSDDELIRLVSEINALTLQQVLTEKRLEKAKLELRVLTGTNRHGIIEPPPQDDDTQPVDVSDLYGKTG